MGSSEGQELHPIESETQGVAIRRYEPPQIVDYGTAEERTELAPSPTEDADGYS